MKIQIACGNIVKQPDAEAIVNSANANLRLGSGVAGAIHTAAGPELEAYCKPFAPIALGDTLLTPGFLLPNKWVIHVRSAHYLNEDEPEQKMRQAIESMLKVVGENNIRSVAMPAIGIGVFKFPIALAAQITAQALAKASTLAPQLEWLRLCVSAPALVGIYRSAIVAADTLDSLA
jgi:O-acetyl-ADP-ribose deacetylase (regulator of RNase III)